MFWDKLKLVFPGGQIIKNLLCNSGDVGSNPGLGKFHMSPENQAPVPQPLKPTQSRLCAPQEKPLQWEVHALQLERGPCSLQLEKALAQQWRPNTAKSN